MTYEADANLTPDKVFILKSEEIADYGVAKQEQLLDLMAEASELYPDASATQVIEFAKQRLLTRNVLSSYQEITAPPLPSLLELTSGPVSEEVPAEEEPTVDEVAVDEPAVEETPEELEVEDTPEEIVLEEETPIAEETEVWYAPEDFAQEETSEEASDETDEAPVEEAQVEEETPEGVVTESYGDVYLMPDVETDPEAVTEPEEVEEAAEQPVDEPEVVEEVVTYEEEELPAEEPVAEAEYTLEEEVEDHVEEEQHGDTTGATSYGTDATSTYPSEEEGSSEEVQAVEQDESPLVTSYQAAPTILKKDRRWVGLLEAAGRLDAKGD